MNRPYFWLGADADPIKGMTARRIQDEVASYYGIPLLEMQSARRGREVAWPRQVAMFLTREMTPQSLPDIGRRFGNRDHTTVMHGITQVSRRINQDWEARIDLDTLRQRLSKFVDKPLFTLRNSLDHSVEQSVKTQEELRAA